MGLDLFPTSEVNSAFERLIVPNTVPTLVSSSDFAAYASCDTYAEFKIAATENGITPVLLVNNNPPYSNAAVIAPLSYFPLGTSEAITIPTAVSFLNLDPNGNLTDTDIVYNAEMTMQNLILGAQPANHHTVFSGFTATLGAQAFKVRGLIENIQSKLDELGTTYIVGDLGKLGNMIAGFAALSSKAVVKSPTYNAVFESIMEKQTPSLVATRHAQIQQQKLELAKRTGMEYMVRSIAKLTQEEYLSLFTQKK